MTNSSSAGVAENMLASCACSSAENGLGGADATPRLDAMRVRNGANRSAGTLALINAAPSRNLRAEGGGWGEERRRQGRDKSASTAETCAKSGSPRGNLEAHGRIWLAALRISQLFGAGEMERALCLAPCRGRAGAAPGALLLLLLLLGIVGRARPYAILHNTTANPAEASPFWNGTSEDEVLALAGRAEAGLRIYIYPIPASATRANTESNQILSHFMMEQHFFRHLRNQHKSMLVEDDPAKANAFFIDHHMLHLSSQQKSCGEIDAHLRDIVNNVLVTQPYYNRSGGADHFFFSVFDHGPFCEHVCQNDGAFSASITATMERLWGANFIGNFGMDDASGDKGYKQVGRCVSGGAFSFCLASPS